MLPIVKQYKALFTLLFQSSLTRDGASRGLADFITARDVDSTDPIPHGMQERLRRFLNFHRNEALSGRRVLDTTIQKWEDSGDVNTARILKKLQEIAIRHPNQVDRGLATFFASWLQITAETREDVTELRADVTQHRAPPEIPELTRLFTGHRDGRNFVESFFIQAFGLNRNFRATLLRLDEALAKVSIAPRKLARLQTLIRDGVRDTGIEGRPMFIWDVIVEEGLIQTTDGSDLRTLLYSLDVPADLFLEALTTYRVLLNDRTKAPAIRQIMLFDFDRNGRIDTTNRWYVQELEIYNTMGTDTRKLAILLQNLGVPDSFSTMFTEAGGLSNIFSARAQFKTALGNVLATLALHGLSVNCLFVEGGYQRALIAHVARNRLDQPTPIDALIRSRFPNLDPAALRNIKFAVLIGYDEFGRLNAGASVRVSLEEFTQGWLSSATLVYNGLNPSIGNLGLEVEKTFRVRVASGTTVSATVGAHIGSPKLFIPFVGLGASHDLTQYSRRLDVSAKVYLTGDMLLTAAITNTNLSRDSAFAAHHDFAQIIRSGRVPDSLPALVKAQLNAIIRRYNSRNAQEAAVGAMEIKGILYNDYLERFARIEGTNVVSVTFGVYLSALGIIPIVGATIDHTTIETTSYTQRRREFRTRIDAIRTQHRGILNRIDSTISISDIRAFSRVRQALINNQDERNHQTAWNLLVGIRHPLINSELQSVSDSASQSVILNTLMIALMKPASSFRVSGNSVLAPDGSTFEEIDAPRIPEFNNILNAQIAPLNWSNYRRQWKTSPQNATIEAGRRYDRRPNTDVYMSIVVSSPVAGSHGVFTFLGMADLVQGQTMVDLSPTDQEAIKRRYRGIPADGIIKFAKTGICYNDTLIVERPSRSSVPVLPRVGGFSFDILFRGTPRSTPARETVGTTPIDGDPVTLPGTTIPAFPGQPNI